MNGTDPIIRVRDIHVQFGRHVVLHDLDLDVYRGEILGFVGASGTGKSVLLRTILGLNRKQDGTIAVLGRDLDKINEEFKKKMIGKNNRSLLLYFLHYEASATCSTMQWMRLLKDVQPA